ncbi:exported hypothetical protein [Vibrio nigripulchritudo SOn1]|uniref:Uncharacterized protein n=1 Tax=Vibrio nigripulchritudo SOn1 TaxID=1238450 RepID=A0AAV2VS43_9VIBR|nr:hypothetical protein [Vibrio nigripulchritudo]CCO47447.1 exported hypothetical protein [Vibrio nigripulchritudo SOn1]
MRRLLFLIFMPGVLFAKSYDFIYSNKSGVFGYSYDKEEIYKLTERYRKYYNPKLKDDNTIVFDDGENIYTYDISEKRRNLLLNDANCPTLTEDGMYFVGYRNRFFSKLNNDGTREIVNGHIVSNSCPVVVGNNIFLYQKTREKIYVYNINLESINEIDMEYIIPIFSVGNGVLVWENRSYYIYDGDFQKKIKIHLGSCGIPVLYDEKNKKLIYSITSTCINWLVGFVSDGLYSYSIKSGKIEHLVKDVFVEEGNGSSFKNENVGE